MNIIVLTGGLGNQMSNFAFLLAKNKNGYSILNTYFTRRHKEHSGYELKRVFNISDTSTIFSDIIVRFARKLIYLKNNSFWGKAAKFILLAIQFVNLRVIVEERNYKFRENILLNKKGINIYIGGWHSEKYYQEVINEIIHCYRFNLNNLSRDTVMIKKEILNRNSVSMHIRRGDFVNNDNNNRFGTVTSVDYYRESIKYISERVENPFFFIFSDDISWAKSNIPVQNAYYVESNTGLDSWQDMYLMSICSHNINANSTFSWWGAWLNRNPNKIVIVPFQFINDMDTPDIYPSGWIKIKLPN